MFRKKPTEHFEHGVVKAKYHPNLVVRQVTQKEVMECSQM